VTARYARSGLVLLTADARIDASNAWRTLKVPITFSSSIKSGTLAGPVEILAPRHSRVTLEAPVIVRPDRHGRSTGQVAYAFKEWRDGQIANALARIQVALQQRATYSAIYDRLDRVSRTFRAETTRGATIVAALQFTEPALGTVSTPLTKTLAPLSPVNLRALPLPGHVFVHWRSVEEGWGITSAILNGTFDGTLEFVAVYRPVN
jgi:hypothetical protein